MFTVSILFIQKYPVNYVDLWGLCKSESDGENNVKLSQTIVDKINTLHPEIRESTTKMLQNLKK